MFSRSDSDAQNVQRRKILTTAGLGIVALSAGCLGSDSTPTEPDGDDTLEERSWKDDVSFGEPVDREIFVEARRYDFRPGTEDPVVVSVGDVVGLAMKSLDIGYHAGHGLGINAYDIRLEATELNFDHTTFVANIPGEFEMWCTVPCSDGHNGMTGTFSVEE